MKIFLAAENYRKENKEQIKAYKSQPFTCPHCARTFQRDKQARHFRSKRCQDQRLRMKHRINNYFKTCNEQNLK